MVDKPLQLIVWPESYAICQLEPNQVVPLWATEGAFWSVTKTEDELTIVCEERHVPGDVTAQRHWRLIQLHGPFELSETGILSSLTAPLAQAGVSVYVVSTYDTDYLMVKQENLEKATTALSKSFTLIHDN
jgi:hypothetical protein